MSKMCCCWVSYFLPMTLFDIWIYKQMTSCLQAPPFPYLLNFSSSSKTVHHVHNYSNWRIGRDRGISAWLWQDSERKDWISLRTFILLASSTETFACYHQKLSCKVWHEVLDFVCSFLALVKERNTMHFSFYLCSFFESPPFLYFTCV